MLLRILTAAVLIPIVVALVWFAPPLVLAGVAAVVAILALDRIFRSRRAPGRDGLQEMDDRLRRGALLRAVFARAGRNAQL